MVVKGEESGKIMDLFLKIDLDERTARNTIANNKVTSNLTSANTRLKMPKTARYTALVAKVTKQAAYDMSKELRMERDNALKEALELLIELAGTEPRFLKGQQSIFSMLPSLSRLLGDDNEVSEPAAEALIRDDKMQGLYVMKLVRSLCKSTNPRALVGFPVVVLTEFINAELGDDKRTGYGGGSSGYRHGGKRGRFEHGEFVINTPCESAQKYWIGGAANHATHTVVFSQLRVNGSNQGIHAFIVLITMIAIVTLSFLENSN
ncbi:hypothetical protein F3Y22_tig00004046pilonHSYRG00013 [Hibiscus syriacus]|uniref:Uncharacterized protein n=1 Tax=Hibiscus syriacus TaxID=106335 RepID=A0A6A3CI75_HIBSY|nr:hypothetical protein F3Y22_tig00004046pilonHSYRG00013 [Hibiscus syriacus]